MKTEKIEDKGRKRGRLVTLSGNTIAKLLKDKGYPHQRLAPALLKKIGTNPHEFGMWVRNDRQPSLTQAHALAQVLGVSVADLLYLPTVVA